MPILLATTTPVVWTLLFLQLAAQAVGAAISSKGLADLDRDLRIELDALAGIAEAATARAASAAGGLSPPQREQVAAVVEQVIRTEDETWLAILQAAARSVIRNEVEASTRKAVLAQLQMLGPAHVHGLADIASLCGEENAWGAVRAVDGSSELVTPEVESALVAVGFIEHERVTGSFTDVVLVEGRYRVSALGRAALQMLHAA
jgi:hypothetical protein